MKKQRLFRWALWWGLGIVAVCLAIILTGALTGENAAGGDLSGPMMNLIYSLIEAFGIWPIIIYIGVVGPIFEELIFRLWGNGRRWTGFTSVVLMAAVSFSVGWWLAVVGLVAEVLAMVLLRDRREQRLLALMLLSSVLFALAHNGNYEGGVFMVAVALLHKLGMGLVASYLVINHNLLWSMAFHIINNSLLAVPLYLSFTAAENEPVVVESDTFRLEMQPLLHRVDTYRTFLLIDEADTTGHLTCGMGCMAWKIIDKMLIQQHGADSKYYNTGDVPAYPTCRFDIKFKSSPFDYRGVLDSVMARGWVAIDTLDREPALELRIADTARFLDVTDENDHADGKPFYSLYNISSILNGRFGNVVYDNDTHLWLRGIRDNLHEEIAYDDLPQWLDGLGLQLVPNGREVQPYRVRSTYDPLGDMDF